MNDSTEVVRQRFWGRKESAERSLREAALGDLLQIVEGYLAADDHTAAISFVAQNASLSQREKVLCADIVECWALERAIQTVSTGHCKTREELQQLEAFLHHTTDPRRRPDVRKALDASHLQSLIGLAERDPEAAYGHVAFFASDKSRQRMMQEAMDVSTFRLLQDLDLSDEDDIARRTTLLKHCTSSWKMRRRMKRALHHDVEWVVDEDFRQDLRPSLVAGEAADDGDWAIDSSPQRPAVDPIEREKWQRQRRFESMVEASGDYGDVLNEAGVDVVLAVSEILKKDETAWMQAAAKAQELRFPASAKLVTGIQAAHDYLARNRGPFL